MSITIASIEFDHVHYDRDADVLYLHVSAPATAVGFDESHEGHALRYNASGDLVGITLVGARELVARHEDVRVNAAVTVSVDAVA